MSGIVIRSEPSRSWFTISLICSLASVPERPWILNSGWAAWISSIAGPTGATRASAFGDSADARAMSRTVVPSGETSPACGGSVSGSRTSSKTGCARPSRVTWRLRNRATASAMAAWKAGSATPLGEDMTR